MQPRMSAYTDTQTFGAGKPYFDTEILQNVTKLQRTGCMTGIHYLRKSVRATSCGEVRNNLK